MVRLPSFTTSAVDRRGLADAYRSRGVTSSYGMGGGSVRAPSPFTYTVPRSADGSERWTNSVERRAAQQPGSSTTTTTTVENVIDSGRLREAWRQMLANAAAELDSNQARISVGAEAADDATLRAGFQRVRQLRDALSESGTGYSPRFMGRGARDVLAETAGARAENRAAARNALVDAFRRFANVRAQAAQELTDSELNAQNRSLQATLRAGGF